MTPLRALAALLLAIITTSSVASVPTPGAPLTNLEITERGELTMEGDDFEFIPWDSDTTRDTVHVIQYFGATLSDRDVFKPFTDMLQAELEPGSVHVSTVLNLDAAVWGTTGFVVSELKKNKQQHPSATMVLDADGDGVDTWALGEAGTGLIIMDKTGIVRYFSLGSPDEKELAKTLELIKTLSGG
ncbi:MAG: hypothetical protein GY764_04960 [Halieaceae bacterium]|nr:hypothetical protein [Halieaceae bacterium]MCP4465893.1 hypothetical protein [Halieaceae bacterium]MCP4843298.1 hypothetical protein [Halieaceae bacterium]